MRKPALRSALCAALAAILGGCGDSSLPDYIRLGGLRILALRADTPEVAPGATVTILPVVSDLPTDTVAGGRTLTYATEACIDPGVGLGAAPTCEGRPDRVAPTGGSGAVTGLDTPTRTFTGEAPTINVPVPATILAGRSEADQFNGVAYLVVYRLTATSATGATETLTAFKRIIASTRPVKNQNPSLTGVAAGSQGLQAFLAALAFPGTLQPKVTLAPAFGAGSAGAYEERTSQTSAELSAKTEELTTTWFLSDGDLDRFRTNGTDGNEWTPPARKPSRPGLVFVVVTRDGRGGEAFLKFEI